VYNTMVPAATGFTPFWVAVRMPIHLTLRFKEATWNSI
jgi:hypothetical protein